MRIQLPVFDKNRYQKLEFHSSSSSMSKYVALSKFLTCHREPYIEPADAKMICRQKTKRICQFMVWVTLDALYFAPVEFFWIFVSCPVYTTMPVTNSVLRRDMPRKATLSLLRATMFPLSLPVLVMLCPKCLDGIPKSFILWSEISKLPSNL